MFRKKKVGFVSEVDQMLKAFDRSHANSEAQLAEIAKYQKIYQLRDNTDATKEDELPWKEF